MRIPSIFRHPCLIRYALRYPRVFVLGFRKACIGGDGLTFDNDPWSPRSIAYDLGRDLRLLGRA